jgi:hypothetical protein
LQDADDTLILIEPIDLGIANLKFILLCYENMSGLKINFDKSKVVVTGVLEVEKRKPGAFPVRYLGLPVSSGPLRVADWEFLPEKVGHRFSCM